MENAIDAGATRITAEIKNGGVSLMRITDNGCGMTEEDALLCIQRHATSKIRSAADLDGIVTLGFRGEALAAIASVSKLRIMTRTADADMGVVVTCEAGKILSVEESGCPLGTTILVEELFANVPARRKFLKRDASETAAVAAVLEKIALSRPDIAIKFITDGNLRFQTAGDGNLQNVIYAVLGRDFAKKTVPVHDMTEGIEVEGVIGTPDNCRGNRNYENFFINGRYVKCGTASAALEQAFSSYIPSDKFPSCVLALTINPAYVDVNVHPQKLEVKFSADKPVFNAVYCAVNNADFFVLGCVTEYAQKRRIYRASRSARLCNCYVHLYLLCFANTIVPQIAQKVKRFKA
jgi:DNA mismatch repair protein MutL